SFAAPQIPVINNIDVQAPTQAAAIRDALFRQAFGPVRWVEVVQAIRDRGVTHLIECGPGKALAGMVKRIDAEAVTGNVLDPATLAATREVLA
ncbi:MAG: malonyl CoA-acyl carrier protein transacylase, partial [Rhizobacter sp.]|nr:malonyl CoA-acyl carrier protein transacylase [Rhizobacter sp.]